jgi:hypothetical protein
MRLLIGTPSANGWVHGHYMQSVLRAVDDLRRHDVEVEYRLMRSHDLGLNRCRLLYESLQIGADYLLQVDSDIGFPVDAPWRLLQWRKEMICVPYLSRHGYDEPGFEVEGAVPVNLDPPLVSVQKCGAGFLMTSRAWGDAMWSRWPNAVFEFRADPSKPGIHAAHEDWIACERAVAVVHAEDRLLDLVQRRGKASLAKVREAKAGIGVRATSATRLRLTMNARGVWRQRERV